MTKRTRTEKTRNAAGVGTKNDDRLELIPDADLLEKRFDRIQNFERIVYARLKENHDYRFTADNEKELLKPGAEKICALVNVRPEYVLTDKTEDFDTPLFNYIYECRIVHIPTDRFLGNFFAACSSTETELDISEDRPLEETRDIVREKARERAFLGVIWGASMSAWLDLRVIDRDLEPMLTEASRKFYSITITGPRQSGKTTLCKTVFPNHSYVNLEDIDVRAFAENDPRGFLEQFPGGAVIDEVQHVPDLLSYLQVMIDEERIPGHWILTGSQNFSLLESISQSLAGRTAVYNLLPLAYKEIMSFDKYPRSLEETILTGSYPGIFDLGMKQKEWFRSYVTTYIERDMRTIGNVGDLLTFQRFMQLCAGRTAQLLNYSSLTEDCGISQTTAKNWFSLLETSFIAFRLPAFHSNLRKRLVKMPKLHFYDTGLVCWLLDIYTPEQLRSHPLRGPIFETWVVSEILKNRTNRGETRGLSFYRDSNGVEADLVIEHPSGITLIEAKSTKTASSNLLSRTLRVREHLSKLHRPCKVVAVYGGNQLQKRLNGSIVPWNKLHEEQL